MKPTTTQDLVDQVRSQVDEENRSGIDTNVDILPALNRAQKHVAEIYAKHWIDPLLVPWYVPLVGGQADYDIPDDALGDRVEKIEILVPGYPSSIKKISFYQTAEYETSGTVAIPYGYTIYQRKIRFFPIPSGIYPARVWYAQVPQQFVLPWGRITRINQANNYLTVDALGSQDAGTPATEIDDLNSFVNIIDAYTGQIKATLQVRNLSDQKVEFKTTPSRDNVWGMPIVGAIPDTVNLDDYICSVGGTCVPYLKDPAVNFFIQYSVAEIRRKLGDAADLEERVKDDFEQEVKASWAGRDQAFRVIKRSRFLGLPMRRYITGNR